MAGSTPGQIWRRMAGESGKAFYWFNLYRELGKDRSLTEVSRQAHVGRQHLGRLSARFNWVKRAQAWDQHLIERRQEKNIEENLEMASRHATIAMMMQERLVTRIQNLTEEEVNQLTPAEINSWLRTSVEVERVSRGLPTQILQPVKKDEEENEDVAPEPVEFQETIISTRQDFLEFKKNLRPDQKLLMGP